MKNSYAEKLDNLAECGDTSVSDMTEAAFNYLMSLKSSDSAEPADPAIDSDDIVSNLCLNLDRYVSAAEDSEHSLSKVLKTARWFAILDATSKYLNRRGLLESHETDNPQPTSDYLDTSAIQTEELLGLFSKYLGYCPEFQVLVERVSQGDVEPERIGEIAEEFGVHPSTVYKRYREFLNRFNGVIRGVV